MILSHRLPRSSRDRPRRTEFPIVLHANKGGDRANTRKDLAAPSQENPPASRMRRLPAGPGRTIPLPCASTSRRFLMRNWHNDSRPWAFAALASLALAATPAARAQVKLEYKYPEGQKLTYKT